VQAMRHGNGFQAHAIRGADAALDPFLMADHFRMSAPTFPPHPHAGFSAVTYLFDDAETGFFNLENSVGHVRECVLWRVQQGAPTRHSQLCKEKQRGWARQKTSLSGV
jgi:hypothetical protein